MALTRKEKEKLAAQYNEELMNASNVVALRQSSIPVNEINRLRMDVYDAGGRLKVVKKRVFLRSLKESSYEEVSLDELAGSLIVLYSVEDEFAPLKVVAKQKKQWKKEKKEFELDYLGGWFDKSWKDSSYVEELANLPTRDELIGKFAFMVRYPLQGFTAAVGQIAKKSEEK
ncbi:50S ribosomal protein L10 [Candidatus Absconditicoccus praedator]|uniref:50S ribosomal protein L10 n=1 Tax=Candidatus Absconditicoccus praedator TaxID=2735562 RepID=UPI001E3C100B|nr:50S ribosomal protein L10 [Candidatus Absconditicoccus praedator]UFX82538.1 50S ribosomal protein L10 [Candidatus Absconditicoccus praedator]